jgi:hypothetical protein
MVTPVQQMLRDYGMICRSNSWMEIPSGKCNGSEFTIHMHAMTGGVIPNPESWFKSELADQNDNINFWGSKTTG